MRHVQYTEDVKPIADVIVKPASPASRRVSANTVVTNVERPPSASKRNNSQRLHLIEDIRVLGDPKYEITHIQKLYHIVVVTSTLSWIVLRNLSSPEKARTVIKPSSISPNAAKMGDLVVLSIRRSDRPATT
jgi:hypothetical protein